MLTKLGKRNLVIILCAVLFIGAAAGVLAMTLGRGREKTITYDANGFPMIPIPYVNRNVDYYKAEPMEASYFSPAFLTYE